MLKKILYIFSFTLIFVSCNVEEELDLVPISVIGDNGFYSNADEVEGGVIAIYDGMQNVPLREFALTEMRSDNAKSKSSEGDWGEFEDFNVTPTNVAVGTYWAANYNVIFRANRVLESLDAVEDATLRNQLEGEARFARALSHFNLVRAYGNVPLIDRVIIQTDVDYFGQKPVADVLAFVISDLETAVGQLGDRSSVEEGRATVAAAQALLGKVKLTTGDYTGAKTALEAVLGNTDYALVDDYSDIFYDEMNSEIIFAIRYLDDDGIESQDFSFEMTNGGVRAGLNYTTDDFADFAADSAGTERSAVIFNPLNQDETGKFLTQSSNVRLCGNDWIVLRLADVHLMYAEAIMAGGTSTSDPDAIASYNAVRERAGMWLLAQGSLSKEMLMNERRAELAFENHRLYDLVRFGVASQVLSDFAVSIGANFSQSDLILPIPQNEINLSQGELVQNPGY